MTVRRILLRNKSIENEPTTRQPSIIPFLFKVGACVLVLSQIGIFKDINSLLDSPAPAVAEADAGVPSTTIQSAEVTITYSPEAIAGDAEQLGDGWYLEANYHDVVQQLNLEQWQKDFLIIAIDSISETIRRGLLINPRIGVMQTTLETGFGKHLAAENNYFGQIAYRDEPYQLTPTFEEEDGSIVHKKRRFKKFDTPFDSFLQYATKIDELKHFDDAEACRKDDANYVIGLENYADPATCSIILPQGTKNSKGEYVVDSYATSTDYASTLLGMVKSLDMNKIFTRRDQL